VILQAFILQQIQLTHMVANDLWDQLQQQRLQLASQQVSFVGTAHVIVVVTVFANFQIQRAMDL
jgi:hypothetical protein